MSRTLIHTGLFVLAAAAMAACGKEQLAGPESAAATYPDVPRPVGLSVDGSVLSRAATTMYADDILSLGIFGYSTGRTDFDGTALPNLFWNKEATRTENFPVWEYDPPAYWPLDPAEKNTFFAYSPYMPEFPPYDPETPEDGPDGELYVLTDEDGNALPGAPQIFYRVPVNVSSQIDLLYSELNDNVRNINYATNEGKVKYKMKHAMLWLRFIISTVAENPGNENERYTVTEFYFSGGHMRAAGVFDLGTGKWRAAPEIVGGDGYENVTYEFDHLWEEDEDGNFIGHLDIPAGEIMPLTRTEEDCLMIIPDNFVMSKHITSIAVSYTHWDGEGEEPENLTEYYLPLPFPDVKLDNAGYVMTYIVKLSTSGVAIDLPEINTIEKWLQDNEQRPIEVF